MIKYSLIFFILFMNTAFAQEKYKVVEGFYNLSSFEVASGIYLLENKTFFYYASFGNVDLKIFGEYSISNQNLLSLQVDQELTKEFYFYGLNNEIQNDSITLYYDRPYSQDIEKLFINTDKEQKRFPEFTTEDNTVFITLKLPKTKKLKIGYIKLKNNSDLNIEKMIEIELVDGVNQIKVYHNYYSEMIIGVSKTTFKIEEGGLIDNNFSKPRTIQKKEISEKIRNEVSNFIKNKKSKTSIIREGKKYQKL